MLHGWLDAVRAESIRRSTRRTLQRLTFSPDVSRLTVLPALGSPAPMQRAVGAFLSNADATLSMASVCFLAWRECSQKAKLNTAAAKWVMERMALSQDGLVVQAVFASWSQLASQNRLPAWAMELKQDV